MITMIMTKLICKKILVIKYFRTMEPNIDEMTEAWFKSQINCAQYF